MIFLNVIIGKVETVLNPCRRLENHQEKARQFQTVQKIGNHLGFEIIMQVQWPFFEKVCCATLIPWCNILWHIMLLHIFEEGLSKKCASNQFYLYGLISADRRSTHQIISRQKKILREVRTKSCSTIFVHNFFWVNFHILSGSIRITPADCPVTFFFKVWQLYSAAWSNMYSNLDSNILPLGPTQRKQIIEMVKY